jgi:hypothetical protein
MNEKRIVLIAVAGVVLVGTLLVGLMIGNGLLGGGGYKTGYAAGIEASKKALVDSGMIPSSPVTINSLSGTVKSHADGRLVITVDNKLLVNPFESFGPAERTVMIDDKTQIIAQIPLAPEKMAAAQKTVLPSGKPPEPLLPYTEQAVKADAIGIGTAITVTSAENIKDAQAFRATKITFVSRQAGTASSAK